MDIKSLRKKKNMTQKDLADALGVDVSVISRYETGKVIPPLKRLEAISCILEDPIPLEIEFSLAQKNKRMSVKESLYSNPYLSGILRRLLTARANGCCELCHKEAPFKDNDGTPYLELQFLDDLGTESIPEENAVVLCPNCHAKIRRLKDASDIEYLKEQARLHTS